MSNGRDLKVGDKATTDFNGKPLFEVTIIDRTDKHQSGSGIMFRVNPSLKYGNENTWYDADWFQSIP